mgnify:FL=1
MIEDKNIEIFNNAKTSTLRINNHKDDFKSERGLKYKKSIENFWNKFYEYFDYYFKHNNKKQHYYEETLDLVLSDLFCNGYDLETKQDFLEIKSEYIDTGMCCYYEENYRDLVLDLMKHSDFKTKRFWVKHYNNLLLYQIDEFIEDFFIYSGAEKNLFSKSFLNLVKYDEYVIYQENLSKTLLSEKYESRWKGKKIKTQDKKTYILKDKNTGYYKIGKSINPLDREKTLQAEKPTYELIKIFNNDIESDLHKKYKKQNVRGEWFNLNKIQLKYICTSYE